MKTGTAVALVALIALGGCGHPTATGAGKTATTVPPVGAAHGAGACHEQNGHADKRCTPGVVNRDVTQANIHSTICVHGWTKTVRPPASYTDRLKVQQIAEYGYADTKPVDYEEDHLVPLELGGHPSDPHNLWPQPHYGSPRAEGKDHVENDLKAAVCSGAMTLDAARSKVLADWTR